MHSDNIQNINLKKRAMKSKNQEEIRERIQLVCEAVLVVAFMFAVTFMCAIIKG